MSDYISREAAIAYIKENQCKRCSDIGLCGKCAVLSAVKLFESVPAADVRPIIKAHWHDVYMTGPCSWAGTCSHCGQANDIPPPRNAHFCPNCGADMREPPKEES